MKSFHLSILGGMIFAYSPTITRSIHPFTHSIPPSIHPSIHLSIHPPTITRSIHPFTHFIHPSTTIRSIHPFTHSIPPTPPLLTPSFIQQLLEPPPFQLLNLSANVASFHATVQFIINILQVFFPNKKKERIKL